MPALSKPLLRRYKTNDHEQVVRLHYHALDDSGANAGPGEWDDDLNNIEQVYLDNNGEFLVIEIDDRIIGMGGLLRVNDTTAEIKRMRIEPEYQRWGWGQMILTELEKRARDFGYVKLILDTSIKLTAAQQLYEKNGYNRIGVSGEGKFEIVLYEKYI